MKTDQIADHFLHLYFNDGEVRSLREVFHKLALDVAQVAWAEGFDAGERDVFQHDEQGWPGNHESPCIPNPYLPGDKP